MRNRSQIHLLRVLAMRMEATHTPETLVKTVRTYCREIEARIADGRVRLNREEERRIERQRSLFAMLPSSDATDRLRDAIAQRAYDLMWDGDALSTDALLEFLPSDLAEQVLDAWEKDNLDGESPKSKWYGAAA
jgi:hypothetical protein